MYLKLIFFLLRERIGLMFSKPKKGQHWCRVVMDEETERLVKELPYNQFDVMEISGSKWQTFGFKQYENAYFPMFDICSQAMPKQYDMVVAEQVFEHLQWPYRAAKNVYAMVKPGGYFLITTPFLIRVHPDPIDCSRWTETGLKYFLAEAGFDLAQIKTGSWGNIECVVSNYNRWTVFEQSAHSRENDPLVPMVVWALARK